ncbi:MAG: hypothetical protein IPJ13_01420 [Saprospiraceae bacterium]|nr:hypothetical protein [Saprospiraceae bacterium]
MKGALGQRYKNKVYPGEMGTSLFILRDKNKKPNGALVVGLGDQFEMTGFRLSQAVRDGIIQAFYQCKDNSSHEEHPFPDTISTLLIGTAYGNLSVGTSMKSILTGIQMANKGLVGNSDGLIVENVVKNVEFLEIFADKALSVFYTLRQFYQDGFVNFDNPKLQTKPGALMSLSVDYGKDKWNQLTIRGSKTCPLSSADCVNSNTKLIFNLNVGIAKEESKEVYIDKGQINDFLYELIKEKENHKVWDRRISKVLFERLIPQDFKVNIRMQNNLVINLDKDAASYPWELIQDTGISDKPICVTAGMIRQLTFKACSIKKRYAENKNVLIIGDPFLDSVLYNQLLMSCSRSQLGK